MADAPKTSVALQAAGDAPQISAAIPNAPAAKLGMLKAAATGGQSAMNEYAAAKNDIGNQQQQALQAAAARSGALNAPTAFIQKQAAIAGLPGNAALPHLNALQAAQSNYLGALQGANAKYLGGVTQSKNLLANLAAQKQAGVESGAYSTALGKALSIASQQHTLANQQKADDKATNDQAIQQAQHLNYQNLTSAESPYSDATKQAAQHILSTADSYASALKQVTSTTNAKGKAVDLGAVDWAGKGVSMNDLLDIIGIQYDPKTWFARNPGAQNFSAPVGTPGGADAAIRPDGL